ncbi:uncharacterized protein [Branchiostoma lanceolatum]|uniref:uncharacterized protein n=1 Tax=Branchiostoma lanceolatum TaxID=7740 RepID=UPI003451582D
MLHRGNSDGYFYTTAKLEAVKTRIDAVKLTVNRTSRTLKTVAKKECSPTSPLPDFNVAQGKTAFQSSTWRGMHAGLAVDGNTAGHFKEDSCTHTAKRVNGPSWWVDLGQSYNIGRVVIFNRQDCCEERLNPFNIHIGDSNQVTSNPKCGGDHQIDLSQSSITISCPGMTGRYVGVSLPGSARTMTLCEVQVFAERSPEHFPDGYTKWRGIYYKVFSTRKSFSESAARCREDGGTLAMPRDDETNAFLISLYQSVSTSAWFGLHDQREEGQFEWIDGTALGEYSSWGEGEPNNAYGGEDCAHYRTLSDKTGWNDSPCSRPKSFICQIVPACDNPQPLGMESGSIPDDSITASASKSFTNRAPFHGRLNAPFNRFWVPKPNKRIGEWLQVDVGEIKRVMGTILQGSGRTWGAWVRSYKLQFSEDGICWTTYGSEKVFPGNTNADSPVTNLLDYAVDARYVRFVVQSWNYYIAMRVEILVCKPDFNIAQGKTAAQSSTQSGMVAGLAVDGNTAGDYYENTCTHTGQWVNEPRWRVDLGQSYTIGRVVIFNRQDCCAERLNPFNIYIGDSSRVTSNPKCGGDHRIDLNQPSITISCQGMTGRYVGVRLPGSARTMTLCEVQVFAGRPL